MKIFKILFVAIIALGMVACNNEDVPDMTGEKDATISIKVFPSSKSAGVRAVGDLSGTNATTSPGLVAESTIKSLEVWVFNSGGALTGYGSSATTEVKGIEAHAGSATVLVAANTSIGLVASKTALEAKLADLPASFKAEDIANTGLIMTGQFTDVLAVGENFYGYEETTEEGKNYLEEEPLAIVRVNARVAIVEAELDLDNVPETQKLIFDKLEDVQVAMFNVPKQTKLFGSPLATNLDFSVGATWSSPQDSYVGSATTETAIVNALLLDATVTGIPVTNEAAPYYYVNENSSVVKREQMFIVLRAKPTMDGNGISENYEGLYIDEDGYTYYPVWVNMDGLTNADGKVTRNTQYNIYLTIQGLGNPYIDPVDKAFLDVKVVVEEWNVVNQNVTW